MNDIVETAALFLIGCFATGLALCLLVGPPILASAILWRIIACH